MLDRFLARDHTYDGRFLTAVKTTGIYCLPSCPARSPLPRNVRFFDSEPEARAAGFRACKRCRPDRFYRDEDPEADNVEKVAHAIADAPAAWEGATDIAEAVGVGSTRLTELFRRHYHTTPAAWLQRQRIRQAGHALLFGRGNALDCGLSSGFESASAFHENFRRETGMSPGAYRKLRRATSFSITLPDDFRVDDTLNYLVRDEGGVGETLDGRRFRKAVCLTSGPAILDCVADPAAGSVTCRVVADRTLCANDLAAAHRIVIRLFPIDVDPGPFERRLARTRGMSRLIRGRRGLRIPRTATLYEGIVWTIVGQQVNLAFAHSLRATLIELCGPPAPNGLRAHPRAEDVARLDVADLARRRYSRRKAEYVIDTSRALVEGSLSLVEGTTEPATRLERRLLRVRGIGPWSANYLLMRGFGFDDCVPIGDVALLAALVRFFDRETRPDADETRELMRPFAPWRSLATFHFWKSLGDPA